MVTEERKGLQDRTEMIGACIKNNRKRLKITQKQLADRVGVSEHHLSMLENGRKNLSSVVVRKIAKELGISSDELFQGEEYVIKRNNADYHWLWATPTQTIAECVQLGKLREQITDRACQKAMIKLIQLLR